MSTTNTWAHIRHFNPSEFDSPDEPGSGSRMDIAFVLVLDELRARLGTPLAINSGYRTAAKNAAVGGKPSSAHTKGKGADIHCSTSRRRWRILHEAVGLGFKRIGIGKTFIHLDTDGDLPQRVCWLY
jgi:uncharacterized protein YcbK (DUF882 family)